MCFSFALRGETKRRPSRNDSATAGSTKAAHKLGLTFLTYMNIYRDSHHSGCQHGQRQKLAEHTVVRPRSRRHVTMTTMVLAVGTFCFYCLTSFMDMNRRQQKHWQKHCQ